MLLRRWNFPRSIFLARTYPPAAAKLLQHAQHRLSTIQGRAFHPAQSAISNPIEEGLSNDFLGTSIKRVPVSKPWRAAEICRTEFPEDDLRSQPCCTRIGSSASEEQDTEFASVKGSDDGSWQNHVVWSTFPSSEERHHKESYRQGVEGGYPESLNTPLAEFDAAVFSWATMQPTTLHQQNQVPSETLSTPSKLGSVLEGAWIHLSRSRPLYPTLNERFQLPLGSQQALKLRDMVSDYKETFVMTTEFGRKSPFSYDWMRVLEFLQYEAQLEESQTGVLHDSGNLTYYTVRPKNEKQSSASEIEVPTDWTQFSFAAFITQVTGMRPLSRDKRRDQSRRHPSFKVVDACLISLFQNPNLYQYFTVDAFNSALTFYYAHKYRGIHRVREIYSLMEKLNMDRDPRTFVIMLMAAAKQQDLALLSYLVVVMIRKGVQPTKKVWLALLETIQSKVARMHTIKTMREHGLLQDVTIIRAVVGLTIPSEVPNHIQSGQDLELLFHLIDTRYGHEWPTTEIGNHMTWALCNNGMFSDILRMWHLLYARGCPPSAYTMTILLRHSKKLFDIGTSIEIVRHFWRLYGVALDATGHETLFRHAWSMRSYNLCKVVWSHACTEDLSHWRINLMLSFSLTRWKDVGLVLRSGPITDTDDFQNSSDAWFRNAGKLIIEADPSTFQSIVEQVEKLRTTVYGPWPSMRWQDRWEEDVARQMLQNKEASLGNKQFRDDFVDVLLKAYEVDSIWHQQSCWMQPTQWKIENAISIPLVDRQPVEAYEETQVQEGDPQETVWRPVLSETFWRPVFPESNDENKIFKEELSKKKGSRKKGRRRQSYTEHDFQDHRRSRSLENNDKGLLAKKRKELRHPRFPSLRATPIRKVESIRSLYKGIRRKHLRPSAIQRTPINSAIQGKNLEPKASQESQPGFSLSSGPDSNGVPSGKRVMPVSPLFSSILGNGGRSRRLLIRSLSIKNVGKRSYYTSRRLGNFTSIQGKCENHTVENMDTRDLPETLSYHEEEPFVTNASTALSKPLEQHQTVVARGLSSKKDYPKTAQNVSLTRSHSGLHILREDSGLQEQRRLAAQHNHQATSTDELRFSNWLNTFYSRKRSGYQPLRESEATTSSFKEAGIRAAVRELQLLDLSPSEHLNESPSTYSESVTKDRIRNDFDALNARGSVVSSIDGLPVVRKNNEGPGKGCYRIMLHSEKHKAEEKRQIQLLPTKTIIDTSTGDQTTSKLTNSPSKAVPDDKTAPDEQLQHDGPLIHKTLFREKERRTAMKRFKQGLGLQILRVETATPLIKKVTIDRR